MAEIAALDAKKRVRDRTYYIYNDELSPDDGGERFRRAVAGPGARRLDMTRCSQGHFYDPGKHTACPWCLRSHTIAPGMGVPAPAGAPQLDQTVTFAAPAPPPIVPPPPAPVAAPATVSTPVPAVTTGTVRVAAEACPPAAPAEATQRHSVQRLGIDPVVGWLVCLDGPERGRDYRIRAEKNFIGRSPSMDICLAGDETVSREKHATIVFEPRKQTFWLVPGGSTGLVYLNGDILHSPAEVKAGDTIELGRTKLVLTPFVGDHFRWE